MGLIHIDRDNIGRNYSEVSLKEVTAGRDVYYGEAKEPKKKIEITDKDLEESINTYLKRVKEERKRERSEEHELGREGVYIEPELMIRKETPTRETPISDKKPGQEKEYEFIKIRLSELLSKKGMKYIVVADSGMGKTTLLKELVLMVAEKKLRSEVVPVYIHLRELENCSKTNDLIAQLADKLKLQDEFINHLYERGRFLFLLDGIDQVFTWGNFPSLFRNGLFGKNMVLVAGRPYAYYMHKDTFKEYIYITIGNFDRIRIQKYLGEYYHQEQVKEFIAQNRAVASIPIILRLIKDIVRGGEFPALKKRTALYGKIIDELLRVTIDLSTLQLPVSEIPDRQTLRKRFSLLSYHTLKQGELGRFSKERVFSDLCSLLQITPEGFNFLTRMGIIYDILESEKETEEIVFRHQSFQEYLAACQLKEELFKDNQLNEGVLKECLEYRFWDETIVFTVGLLDKERAKILIRKIEGYDSYLAGLCLGEYRGGRSDFGRLMERLFKGIVDEEARKVLVRIADIETISKLIERLKDKDKDVRWNAAYALGDIGSDKAVEPLIERLKDEDKDVRWRAANALGNIGSDRAVEPLIERLKDEDEDVRWRAACALGDIGSDKAVEPLIEQLKDKNEVVRLSAAEALGNIAKRLTREKQDNLVNCIYSIKLMEETKEKVITSIRQATGRRFIKGR